MREPGSLDGTVAAPIGQMPARSWAQYIFVNQLTYGWDLASATGQDSTIPPSLLEAAHRAVRDIFVSGMPRMPELFDVEVPVGDRGDPDRAVRRCSSAAIPGFRPSRCPR